jgi:adenylosuccinate synthase
MPAIVLVGAQWGDEGKGKATDLLGSSVDYVVRYQGGNNAGHTVVIGGESYALHLLPAGVLSPGVIPVIGNGVVIDPGVLFGEIDGLRERGIPADRLLVSASAHLIMPHHRALDKVTERYLGNAKIGTTGRGIGPAYGDKIARVGIRVQDLFDPGILRQKLDLVLREKNQVLTKVYNRRGIDADAVAAEYVSYGERLRPHVADTGLVLGRALDEGRVVLLEGSQGTLLDVDHGSYPFVTSSSPTAGGACSGSGIGPTRISKVIGILKAYTTRVGSGPFPTELLDEHGEYLRTAGGEYGVTTGRNRRTGWFDAVIGRYATRVNGITDYFLTKLDVLSGLEKVPVCVAYEVDGERQDEMPVTQTGFHHARPVYEHLDG